MKKAKCCAGRQENANNPYWSRPTMGKSVDARMTQLMTNNYAKSGAGLDLPERGPVIASPRRTMIGGV
jgi:hypothetical protein